MKKKRRGERRIDRMKGLHKKEKMVNTSRRKGGREKPYAKKIKHKIEYYYSAVMNHV